MNSEALVSILMFELLRVDTADSEGELLPVRVRVLVKLLVEDEEVCC